MNSLLFRTRLWWMTAAMVLLTLGLAVLLTTQIYQVPLASGRLRFERPYAWPLLLAGPLIFWARALLRPKRTPRLRVSESAVLQQLPPSFRSWLAPLLDAGRIAAITAMALGVMGPQSIHARNAAEVRGIDIVLALDMSLSMRAADIKPNRFAATQAVVDEFILRRPNDRLGSVVFGRDAFTLLPLTTDHEALRTLIADLQLEMIDGKGTAIGNAIGTGLNRLRKSDAKSRIIILLTDGDSNSGNVSPLQSADFAQALGVKVYTILMGQADDAPIQAGTDLFGNPLFERGNFPINPELLQSVAEKTGGQAFQVQDRKQLEQSFHVILDQLEKSDIEDAGRVYGELFPALVGPALFLLFIELLLSSLVLRRWP